MPTIDIKHMKLYNNQVKMNSKTLRSAASEAKIQTKRKPKISLIIGGARSGKSSYALEYTLGFGNSAAERAVVSTSSERVDEIKSKCLSLNKDIDDSFLVFQESDYVAKIVEQIPHSAQIILIDSISDWIANLIIDEKDTVELKKELKALIEKTNKDIILISNIVGLGIIPEKSLEREFRDESGFFNQELAKIANNVILMVAGIPVAIKGELL
ncbi:MAG: bifunctional adenosylcobinamide kinase/adenosylcobinamide-phosphate guanylyltransferase [Sphaerochaetaceae bacterium]|nr:bifunctional adenosylcobinamide kinase/adenosylcobinamide-phosphate guanylyltransferase [Sphaerochaetaceae bacterium]